MPTKQEIDEFITQKCVEANPEILKYTRSLVSCGKVSCKNIEHSKPLQIADILMAIPRQNGDFDTGYGASFFGTEFFMSRHSRDVGCDGSSEECCGCCGGDMISKIVKWNLLLPYSSQSIETKRFIYNLLKQ